MDLEGQKSERTDLGDVAKAALNFKFVQSSVQDRFLMKCPKTYVKENLFT